METIKTLYIKYGSNTYEEDVTQLEHAKQCATEALNDGAPDFVVVAAFLHDIGHLLTNDSLSEQVIPFPDNLGNQSHEILGAHFLEIMGMPDNICQLVAKHVYTKRYLVSQNSSYYDHLSDASKRTLKYQGGPLNESEGKAFELDPLFNWHLKLRGYDDGAKDPCVVDEHIYFDLIGSFMNS